MPYIEHFLLEAVKFAAFAFVCGSLIRPRFRGKTTVRIAAVALLGILALQTELLMAGLDETLVLTLLPVTAYLPAILAVHVLSNSNFLQTVSVWSTGVLLSFTLLFLQKLLNIWLPHHTVVRCWRRPLCCPPWCSASSAGPSATMCWRTEAAGFC